MYITRKLLWQYIRNKFIKITEIAIEEKQLDGAENVVYAIQKKWTDRHRVIENLGQFSYTEA